jgi:Zn-dependent protease with chaperone function
MTTWAALGVCLSLLCFGLVSACAALPAAPLFRRAASGDWSADALLALRYAPTLAALLVTGGVFVPAWLRLEPRESGERVGAALLALAALAVAMIGAGALRGARALLATRRLRARWAAGAETIAVPGASCAAFAVDDEFPLAALAGILRPRLLLARRLFFLCTPDEMAAIVAHEESHLRRRDNLKRLLFASCPDLLGGGRIAAGLEAAWEAASDRAADDDAVRAGWRAPLTAALVKVGIAAASAPFPTATGFSARSQVSTLARDGAIAARVRRLIDDERERATAVPAWRWGLFCGLGAVLLVALDRNVVVLFELHAVTETIVRLLQ